MPRFYIPRVGPEKCLVITGSDARHILKVLRLKENDPLTIWDDTGQEYLARITGHALAKVTVAVEERLPRRQEGRLRLSLAQALPKGEKMDLIVQKATELGVATIVPFFNQRSAPRLTGAKQEARHKRLQRIAYEAAKQSGRLSLPQVERFCSFSEVLESAPPEGLKIIFYEQENELLLKKLLSHIGSLEQALLVVGPEGGFTEEEVAQARKKGFVSVSLGPRILRTETVALALLSIFQFAFGDLG